MAAHIFHTGLKGAFDRAHDLAIVDGVNMIVAANVHGADAFRHMENVHIITPGLVSQRTAILDLIAQVLILLGEREGNCTRVVCTPDELGYTSLLHAIGTWYNATHPNKVGISMGRRLHYTNRGRK